MDVVVYLALAVLLAVFCISFGILVVMCRRRYEYNRLLVSHSARFSKLKHDNDMNSVVELNPHISQTLDSNQWLLDVSGVLQHCVAVLKLCHTLTDKLAKIPLDKINPQLNEVICQATSRVVPAFDSLLHTLALPNVDVRILEARVTSLTTACWSLVVPFYILDPKYRELFGDLVREMETHQQVLAATTARLNAATKLAALNSTADVEGGDEAKRKNNRDEDEDESGGGEPTILVENRRPGPSTSGIAAKPSTSNHHHRPRQENGPKKEAAAVTLPKNADELAARKELLGSSSALVVVDETAPTDPHV